MTVVIVIVVAYGAVAAVLSGAMKALDLCSGADDGFDRLMVAIWWPIALLAGAAVLLWRFISRGAERVTLAIVKARSAEAAKKPETF